jgi:hypothetical protein
MVLTKPAAAPMRIVPKLTVLAFVLAAALPAVAQSGPCFADWAAASSVVKSQGLVTVEQLTRLAQSKVGGEIVRTQLCEDSSGYVYKLVVKEQGGQIKNVIVDAKRPFER